MSSHGTTLTISNQTAWSTTITVDRVENYDWDGQSRPDKNFDDVRLSPGETRSRHEELNAHAKSAHFQMTFTFPDGQWVRFFADQYDARNGIKPNPRTITLEGNATSSFSLTQSVDTKAATNTYSLTSNLHCWMANLPDSKSLSQITIPGTHDSGATKEASKATMIGSALLGGGLGALAASTIYSSAKCQDLTITQQLNLGLRALDIRCTIDGPDVVLCHGIVSQDTKLRSVFEQCQAFLRANPRETIFMSLKCDWGDSDDVGRGIVGLTYDFPNLFYTSNTIPKLGQVRGKIVVGRRFPYYKGWGLNLSEGWCDNKNFSFSYSGWNGVTQTFYVQDTYNLSDPQKKWDNIWDCLQASPGMPAETLIFNFASAVGGEFILEFIPNPKSMAVNINNRLTEYFQNHRGRYGLIMMDFPTGREVAEIINSNF